MATIVGLQSLNLKLDKLAKGNTKAAMADACMLVEKDAKTNAPVGETGELRNSITSEYDEKEGRIGTNLFYAPYVHQGTGKYAINGDGRQGYWVYVKGSNGESNSDGKEYTLEEAKQICAILISKGLEAYYTDGQPPRPFLADAFEANREKIAEIFAEKIKEAVQ